MPIGSVTQSSIVCAELRPGLHEQNSGGAVSARPNLSVVLPVYKTASCLEELYNRLTTVLSALCLSYEIIFIDDSSPDTSWSKIQRLSENDCAVRGMRLSRNFGQHAAISAGLSHSRGERVIVMDADLQDPPETLVRLLQQMEAQPSLDIVLARRVNRKFSLWRNVSAALYFGLLNWLTGSKLDGSYATFSLLSRKVVDAYLTLGDSSRHYLMMLNWLGFERAVIEYEHGVRSEDSGASSYSFSRLFRHAMSGLYFQSSAFLEKIALIGLLVTGVGLVCALVCVGQLAAGCFSPLLALASLMILLGGFQATCLGLVAMFVGQSFEQAKRRPLFVIDREIGFSGECR